MKSEVIVHCRKTKNNKTEWKVEKWNLKQSHRNPSEYYRVFHTSSHCPQKCDLKMLARIESAAQIRKQYSVGDLERPRCDWPS
jgi:hypothetical protein